MTGKTLRALLAGSALALVLPSAALAQTAWTGGGPSAIDWFDPANWSAGLPTAMDALDFTSIPLNAPGFPVLTSGNPGVAAAGSVIVGNQMFSFIDAGNTLNVTNGVTVLPSDWNQGGFGTPSLWIKQNGTLDAGGGTTNSGWLWVAGTLRGGLTNSGTAHSLGIANLAANTATIDGAIVNQAGGTFDVWGGMPALSITGGSLQMNDRFDNAGTLLLGSSYAGFSGGDLSGITTLTNTGLVQVDDGLTLTANKVANNAGGTITNDGAIVGVAGVAGAHGGTITNSATGSLIAGIGDVANAGMLTNDGVIIATMSEFTNAATGIVTNSGAITGMAGVSNAAGGSITNTATGILLADSGDLTNAGTLTNANGGLVSANNGQIVNAAGGKIVNSGTMASLTGLVNASGGTLINNGIITGGVSNSGRIGGSGSFDSITLNSGGLLVPGNSIGALNTVSTTFNSGSTYEVELKGGGFTAGTHNDLITATGTVTIDGGATVHVTPENGTDDGSTYTPGTYTIITAAGMGGVNGTFGAVTDDYAFLDFTLSYNLNNVFLTSALVGGSPCGTLSLSANQAAACGGLFSVGFGSLYTAALGLSTSAAPGALDQVSGELHASTQSVLTQDSGFVRDAATERVRVAFDNASSGTLPLLAYGEDGAAGIPADPDRGAVWMQAYGALRSWVGGGRTAATSGASGGLLIGGEAAVSDTFRLGLLGGYGSSGFNATGLSSSGTASTWHLGLYGGGEWGGFGLRGGAAYAWHTVATSRSVVMPGFADTLTASHGADTAQGFVEAGYRFEKGAARFEPYASVAHVNVATAGFTETGGAAALTVAPASFAATFTTLGMRAGTDIRLGGRQARLAAGLGWRHAFGAAMPTMTAAFAGGTAFAVSGVPVARDALIVDLGADVALGSKAKLGLAYSGQIASGFSDHSLRAKLGGTF